MAGELTKSGQRFALLPPPLELLDGRFGKTPFDVEQDRANRRYLKRPDSQRGISSACWMSKLKSTRYHVTLQVICGWPSAPMQPNTCQGPAVLEREIDAISV